MVVVVALKDNSALRSLQETSFLFSVDKQNIPHKRDWFFFGRRLDFKRQQRTRRISYDALVSDRLQRDVIRTTSPNYIVHSYTHTHMQAAVTYIINDMLTGILSLQHGYCHWPVASLCITQINETELKLKIISK